MDLYTWKGQQKQNDEELPSKFLIFVIPPNVFPPDGYFKKRMSKIINFNPEFKIGISFCSSLDIALTDEMGIGFEETTRDQKLIDLVCYGVNTEKKDVIGSIRKMLNRKEKTTVMILRNEEKSIEEIFIYKIFSNEKSRYDVELNFNLMEEILN